MLAGSRQAPDEAQVRRPQGFNLLTVHVHAGSNR
jgi:hypothetical protein